MIRSSEIFLKSKLELVDSSTPKTCQCQFTIELTNHRGIGFLTNEIWMVGVEEPETHSTIAVVILLLSINGVI